MLAGLSLGMPPLEKIQADNLAAAEILIGQVMYVGPDPDSQSPTGTQGEKPAWDRFSLRIVNVVKSRRGSQPGNQVEVRFLRELESPIKSGMIPVQVSAGDLVIVFANPKEKGQELLVPVYAGFSIIRLKPLPPDQQAVPFPQPPR